MIFFMSRTRFEQYVKEHCDSIADQYVHLYDQLYKDMNRLENNVGDSNQKYNGRMDEILRFCRRNDTDLKKLSERITILEQTEPTERTSDPTAEMEKYAESLRQELKSLAENRTDQSAYENEIKIIRDTTKRELGIYLEEKMSSYSNAINQELERRNTEIQQLKLSLYHEKKTSEEMIAHIRKQNQEIERLSACILKLQQEMADIAVQTRSLQEPVTAQHSTPDLCTDEQKFLNYVFSDDSAENMNILNNYISQSHKLREQMQVLFEGREEGDIYLKLFDKCIRKLESLVEKNKERFYEADKLANESAKIFKQTIAKAMSQKQLRERLDQYMKACGIRKLDWRIGKVLENDDYGYLEEPILYDEVSDPKLNNTITEIRQDTYLIDYREDDRQYEAVIPGIYSIGRYRN